MENKILAAVGGMNITEADVNEFILSLGARGENYNTAEGREIVLNQLIDGKLLLLDARRNLYEGDAEYRARLNKLKENLLINYAAERAMRDSANVSDSEIEKYYADNKEKFAAQATVNASHILVDTKDEAEALLAEIKSGSVSFEDAASKSSKCPSGQNGGSLGDFARGTMVPEFEEAAFAMAEGEISEPVKTQFGYHIIKLNSKAEGEATPLEAVRDNLKSFLIEQKQRSALESRINQLKILYPVDKF